MHNTHSYTLSRTHTHLHTLTGEACVGLQRYKQAEEYLSLAKWAVLKKPDCSNSLKSNLYRNFGKLYFSQGKYQDALYQLANGILHTCAQMRTHAHTPHG